MDDLLLTNADRTAKRELSPGTVPIVCLVGLLPLIGCAPAGGNGDGQADPASDLVGATISLPQVSADRDSELIAVMQDAGVSGSFVGTVDDTGTTTITAIRGETTSGEFVTSIDNQLRTDRVVIGDTEVDIDYTGGSDFTFEVSRGDQAFSGSGFFVTNGGAARDASGVSTTDLLMCAENIVEQSAVRAALVVDGVQPEEEFIACVLEQEVLREIAEVVCTTEQVLLQSLVQFQQTCFLDLTCGLDRIIPAVQAAVFSGAVLRVVIDGVTTEIRSSAQLCPIPPDDGGAN